MTTTNNNLLDAWKVARLAWNKAMRQSFEADLAHAEKQAERIEEEVVAEIARKALINMIESDSPLADKQIEELTKEFKNLRSIAFNTSLFEASLLRSKREASNKFAELTTKYYAASDAYQTFRGF